MDPVWKLQVKINHFPISKRELRHPKGLQGKVMASEGKKEVMRSAALTHTECNMSNDLQADRLPSRLGSCGWHLLGSSNSVVQGHFHMTHDKAEQID